MNESTSPIQNIPALVRVADCCVLADQYRHAILYEVMIIQKDSKGIQLVNHSIHYIPTGAY